MTFLVHEGFDLLAPGGGATMQLQLQTKGWQGVPNTLSLATGRYGGRGLAGPTNSNINWQVGSSIATGVVGFALQRISTPGALPWRILELRDGTSNQVGIGLDSSRHVYLYRGLSTNILATGTRVLPATGWDYIELKVTIHNTAGSYEVRLNGEDTPELIASGVNTRSTANNSFSAIYVFTSEASVSVFDDFYALNGVSSPNNDFLGECRVETLVPNGAGSSTQWTPQSGSNWQMVDDAGFDGDTSYNDVASTGQVDLFTTAGLSGSPVVHAAQVTIDATKTDAGISKVRTKLKSGATTANGATQVLPASYVTSTQRYDTDPAGGNWTASKITALEIGYESVA